MRKAVSVAIILSLVFSVSLAYACGEKKTSAENTKSAKTDLSNTGSTCSVEKSAAISKVKVDGGASVMTTESSNMCGAEVKHADYHAVSNPSGCSSHEQKANLKKASAQKSNGKGGYCSAAAASNAACLRDEAKSSDEKAQPKKSDNSQGMVSVSEKSATEVGALK